MGPRTKYSVFCDEHHEEALRGLAAAPGGPRDASDVLRERFEKALNAYERNLITREELSSTLFDCFVHAHTHGLAEHCGASLDGLPVAVLGDLLAYAEAHPEPRVFYPRPSDPERRRAGEWAALAAQAALIARLREKSK